MQKTLVEYSRIRNGVVRPIPEWIENSPDHQLIIVRADEFGPDLGRFAEGAARHARACTTSNEFKSIVVNNASNWSLHVSVLTVTGCQHQTSIICGLDGLVDPNADLEGLSGADEAVRVAKRLWSERSRAGSARGFIDEFRTWLRAQLDIRLNEAIRHPYSMALSWTGAPGSAEPQEFLRPLIGFRAALSDMYTISKTHSVDPSILECVDSAARRIEVALVGLTAWQTVILDNAARKLSEAAEKRDEAERFHDRRIADLGAITLFPLIIFSFLGSNVLPAANFPYALKGPIWLALSIVLAVGAAIAGRAWIRRGRVRERKAGDERN
ncbi:hypothetical protein [Mycobacterium sp. GA-1841]|uniref:hypothetical protein n=1 Tax=Mycobacterium sp. GA-1841 TaxID=1834154 RepID=UPI001115A987|nr:hypothetical protein [Mycobacterium sp. GA-1841]